MRQVFHQAIARVHTWLMASDEALVLSNQSRYLYMLRHAAEFIALFIIALPVIWTGTAMFMQVMHVPPPYAYMPAYAFMLAAVVGLAMLHQRRIDTAHINEAKRIHYRRRAMLLADECAPSDPLLPAPTSYTHKEDHTQ